MKKIILIIVSLFFAGFSFCQISNLNGGLTDPISTLTINDTLTVNGVFNYSPPHAHFAFADSAVTLDMSTNVWSTLTNPTNNLFIINDTVQITFSDDSVTIQKAGDYILISSISFSGSAADAYEFAFFINGVINGVKMERTTSQTDVGNLGLPTYLEDLEPGDGITLKVRNTNSNDDATLASCSWVMWLLHPE